ncbi:hypothetical protein U879_03165 [Defluviimonas sp. 20V17]|nr:hypothetical protein U879_03165 [Defluviimonas sp. 20V17]
MGLILMLRAGMRGLFIQQFARAKAAWSRRTGAVYWPRASALGAELDAA